MVRSLRIEGYGWHAVTSGGESVSSNTASWDFVQPSIADPNAVEITLWTSSPPILFGNLVLRLTLDGEKNEVVFEGFVSIVAFEHRFQPGNHVLHCIGKGESTILPQVAGRKMPDG